MSSTTSVLGDFAEFFKSRRTKVERYYEDGVGRFAFRVTVEGQAFVCAARSNPPKKGKTSIMARVAGKAQTTDALILLRLRDDMYVFDPVTVLGRGEADEPVEEDRKKRGEKWVHFPVSLGCDFREWVDGTAEPVRYHDYREA